MQIIAKKTAALLLVLCLTITGLFVPGVDAANGMSEQQLFDLKSFGIVEGEPDGNMRLEDPITRAEFAKTVVLMLQMGNVAEALKDKSAFPDVASSDWFAGYVSAAEGLGLVGGDENGYFNPNDNILFNEAVKILTCALGFGQEAQRAGGYPNGYLVMGQSAGVLRGVAPEEGAISRATAFSLLYNCLDAQRLVQTYDGSGSSYVSQQTLRDILMGNESDGLLAMTGIVTANRETWLLTPREEMKENEVEIDGVLMDAGETAAAQYLGQEVNAYISMKNGERLPVIKNIVPTVNNKTVDLKFDDIVSFNDREIVYFPEDNNRKMTRQLSDPTVVYNGRIVKNPEKIDFDAMKDGSVRLLCNKGNTSVDIIFIREYQSYIIDRVDEADRRIYLAHNQLFDGRKFLTLDEEEIVYTLTDESGQPLTFDELKAGEMITVSASEDRACIRVLVSSRTVEGVAVAIDKEKNTVTIDGTEFEAEASVKVSELLGKSVTAWLNYEDKIGYCETAERLENYGAVVGVSIQELGEIRVQMVVPALLSDESVESEDEYDAQDIPAISGKNKTWMTLSLSSKIGTNSGALSAAKMAELLQDKLRLSGNMYVAVNYSLDADGKIRRLQFPELYKQGDERTYNAYEKTYSDGVDNPMNPAAGAFGLADDTLGVCIPDNGGEFVAADDYLAEVSMNNGQSYYIEAYDYDEKTRSPKLVVICAPMRYETSGIPENTSKTALVSEISTELDEDGQEVRRVTMQTSKGEITARISDHTNSTADFDALRQGSLILYSLDGADRLDGFEMIMQTHPIPAPIWEGKGTDKEIFCGTVETVNYDVVSIGLNKWVDELVVSDNAGNTVRYHIPKKSTPPIYIYDESRKQMHLGTREDLSIAHERVVVYASGMLRGVSNVKAVVLIV